MDWLKQLRAASVCLALAVAVTTAGCSAPQPTTSPTVSSAAPSESDDAVLAEAIDVYTRYSAALDLALSEGDGELEELSGLVTASFLRGLAADDVFAANEWTTTGSTSFDSQKLIEESSTEIVMTLCRDVSRIRVLDADGRDVTPVERDDRFAVIVTLQRVDPGASLLVAGSEPRSEDESCDV